MANKKIPMRKCVGCQEMKEKKSLIRVVKTAEGDIILDDTGKKNGRGAYICKSLECFKKAKKTKVELEESNLLEELKDIKIKLLRQLLHPILHE